MAAGIPANLKSSELTALLANGGEYGEQQGATSTSSAGPRGAATAWGLAAAAGMFAVAAAKAFDLAAAEEGFAGPADKLLELFCFLVVRKAALHSPGLIAPHPCSRRATVTSGQSHHGAGTKPNPVGRRWLFFLAPPLTLVTGLAIHITVRRRLNWWYGRLRLV